MKRNFKLQVRETTRVESRVKSPRLSQYVQVDSECFVTNLQVSEGRKKGGLASFAV